MKRAPMPSTHLTPRAGPMAARRRQDLGKVMTLVQVTVKAELIRLYFNNRSVLTQGLKEH